MWILPQSLLKFKKENSVSQIKHLQAELCPVFNPKQAVPRVLFNTHVPNLWGPKCHSNQAVTSQPQERASVSKLRCFGARKSESVGTGIQPSLSFFPPLLSFLFFFFQLPFATMKGKEPPLGDRERTLLTQPKFNFCEVHN